MESAADPLILSGLGLDMMPLGMSTGLGTGTGAMTSDEAFTKLGTEGLDSVNNAETDSAGGGAVDGSSIGEKIFISSEMLSADPCMGNSVTDGIAMGVLDALTAVGTDTLASELGDSVIRGTKSNGADSSGARIGGMTKTGAPFPAAAFKDSPFITGMSAACEAEAERSGTAPVASETNTGGASAVVKAAATSGGTTATGTSTAAGPGTAGTAVSATPAPAA